MEPDRCQECGCALFTIKTIWHPEPRFSRTPAGTVDVYIKCANCGCERHDVYELQDPVATTDKQSKEQTHGQP